MIYGYETTRDDTTVITSTQRNIGMVFIESFTIQPGFSNSKAYSKVAAGGLRWQSDAEGSHTFSVSYDSTGAPVLNWVAGPYNSHTSPTTVSVFATKLVTPIGSYGISITDDAGNVLVSPSYPVPQKVGYLDFNTAAQTHQAISDGYTLYTHVTTAGALAGLSSRRFLVLGLPDVGAEDTWYATDLSMLPSGASNSISLFVFTKSATYKLPRLFIFALDTVNPTPQSHGIQVYTDTQKLLYDAGAENMALLDMSNIDYPPYGNTLVKTVDLRQATYIGITSPNTYWEAKDGTFLISGYAGAKRIGNQLSFRLMKTSSVQQGTTNFTPAGGATSSLMCAMVDLTYLGFVNGDGTGGGSAVGVKPTITTNPANQRVASGSTAVFSVAATGDSPLTYEWYHNGVRAGTNSPSYSFTASTVQDGQTVYCVVSNPYGVVQSNAAYIQVYVASSDVPVSITSTTPADRTVEAGSVATFSVTANGTAPFTYQWYRNGYAVGTNSSSYSFTTTTTNNGDIIWCEVTNGGGAYSASSRIATLTVTSASSSVPVAISGSTPANVQVLAGNVAAFSVSVTGTAPFVYKWYRNGSSVGTNSASYSYATTTANNGDSVWCVVTNNDGANSATSRQATVTVTSQNYPVITRHPSDVTANPGQVVYMRCEASPATRFSWYRNGTYVGDGQSLQLNTDNLGDYTYQCTVYNNTLSQDSNPATLHVVPPTPTTFESYNDFSYDADVVDNNYTFTIQANGSTSNNGYPWANGTGDGSLYRVKATASGYTLGSGSSATGSQITLPASWVLPKPVSTQPGASVTHVLNVTVYLNGSAVCSGTITAVLRNRGGVVT